jgi:hypothetical protein
MTLETKVDVNVDVHDLLAQFGLEEGGIVQQVIDKSVIDYCMPYVPHDTGTLETSPYAVTVIGSGEVVYPGPYAHYMYYGEVYGPNIPVFIDDSGEPAYFFSPPGEKKHPTGKQLQYSTDYNPLAGPFWLERMKADHLQDIIEDARKNVRR